MALIGRPVPGGGSPQTPPDRGARLEIWKCPDTFCNRGDSPYPLQNERQGYNPNIYHTAQSLQTAFPCKVSTHIRSFAGTSGITRHV